MESDDESSNERSKIDTNLNKKSTEKLNFLNKLAFYKQGRVFDIKHFKSMLQIENKTKLNNQIKVPKSSILLTENELKHSRAKSLFTKFIDKNVNEQVKVIENNRKQSIIKNFNTLINTNSIVNPSKKVSDINHTYRINTQSNTINETNPPINKLELAKILSNNNPNNNYSQFDTETLLKEENERDINTLMTYYNQHNKIYDKNLKSEQKRLFQKYNIPDKITSSDKDLINKTLHKVKRNYYDTNTNNTEYYTMNTVNTIGNTTGNMRTFGSHIPTEVNYDRYHNNTKCEAINELFSNPNKALGLIKKNKKIHDRCEGYYKNIQIEKYNEKFEEVSKYFQ